MPAKRTKPSFEPSGMTQTPGEGAYSLLGSLEERERVEPCRSNLRQIGIALTSYQLEHEGEWPNWLSDLYPKYLQDESILLCPNHPSATVYRGLIDPKMKCSYVYEFAPIEWDGAIYRDIQKAKLEIYGDKVPVVRCLKCLEDGRALNLSYGGEIYLSGEIWGRRYADGQRPRRRRLRDSSASFAKSPPSSIAIRKNMGKSRMNWTRFIPITSRM